MNLKPLADHLIVKPIIEKEKFNIVLPSDSQEKTDKGEVVAVGPGRILDNGNRLAMSVQVGDKVMFKKYAAEEIKVADEDFLVLSESDLIAIINN